MENMDFVMVPVLIGIGFVILFVVLFSQARQRAYNNKQPVLSAPARVVTKRSARWRGGKTGSGGLTSYYATFELETGERREFWLGDLGGKEYDMLADGDEGTLTYQGTRYHGFQSVGR